MRALEVVIDPDNVGSHRVARRNGFARIGERDGRVVYRREITRSAERPA